MTARSPRADGAPEGKPLGFPMESERQNIQDTS